MSYDTHPGQQAQAALRALQYIRQTRALRCTASDLLDGVSCSTNHVTECWATVSQARQTLRSLVSFMEELDLGRMQVGGLTTDLTSTLLVHTDSILICCLHTHTFQL